MDSVILGFALMAFAGLAFSALFSGMETGIYTLNRVRLMVNAGRGEGSAVALRRELQQPNRLLSTLLIGNNLANYAGSYAVAAILDHLHFGAGQAVAINAALLIPLLFVFGEVLPKDLFRSHTDVWTYACARLLHTIRLVLTVVGLVPLVTAFGEVSSRMMRQAAPGALPARERMAQLMLEGVGAGVISESQAGLLDRALALRNRKVENAMLPWRRVSTLPADAKGAARTRLLEKVRQDERVVILDEAGQPIGAAQPLMLLLEPNTAAGAMMTPIAMIPTGTTVPRALQLARSANATTAIVMDARTKKPAGLVTILNLVEPLTGGSITAA
jgi:CBS domain containing-hemolysin-like protein